MKILVTGSAGFIGAALSEALLARGDSVIGVDNCNNYYDVALKQARLDHVGQSNSDRFAFVKCDFADKSALDQALQHHDFDTIVHLGAQAGVRYSIDNPQAYIQSNLVGHANILELAREREIDHLVYASSSSVYGGNTKTPFAVTDRVDHPLSLYAATKKSNELMSETYAHLYRLPQTGLRFFTVYGPWGRPDMMPWRFTQRILAEEPIPVYNHGQMYRDFTYIDDIIAGVLAALDHAPKDDDTIKAGGSSKPHALYNIGNHRSEKLMRFVELLEQACGKKAQIEMLDMQPGDVERTYADIDAIRDDLGYEPATAIEQGVPKFVAWYRDYHSI